MMASRFLSRLAPALVLALGACVSGGRERSVPLTETPGTALHQLQVGELARTYLLHVPPTRPRRRGKAVVYPLVIVLHGSGANGETVRRESGMDSIADAQRFLIAYPNATAGPLGLGSDWNAGDCCGPARSGNVDDVGFIKALVGALEKRLPVDRRRIYVAGFSDGARMTYRIACELGTRVAAIAVVSGSLVDASCAPRRAVPLIAFHGTSDDEVSYQDSSRALTLADPPMRSADAPPSVVFWATIDHCRAADTTPYSPHVTLTRFVQCAADVMLYTLEGGEHAWPRGRPGSDGAAGEIDASREAWRFFASHPQP